MLLQSCTGDDAPKAANLKRGAVRSLGCLPLPFCEHRGRVQRGKGKVKHRSGRSRAEHDAWAQLRLCRAEELDFDLMGAEEMILGSV